MRFAIAHAVREAVRNHLAERRPVQFEHLRGFRHAQMRSRRHRPCLMGSAALYSLVRRGVDALGFDPLVVGEARGSSHGSCRIYRRFNFECDAYTELSGQGLRRLARAGGRMWTHPPQGKPRARSRPPGSQMVADSRASALRKGAISGPTNGAEASAVFPALNLPDDWDVVVQESGRHPDGRGRDARLPGSRWRPDHPRRAQKERTPDGIRITTAHEQVMAEKIIVAAGPWIAPFIPGLGAAPQGDPASGRLVSRPPNPKPVRYGDFPIFLVEGRHGMVYGFPDFEGRGVKAALHEHGPIVGPDEWYPPATDAELGSGEQHARRIPARCVRADRRSRRLHVHQHAEGRCPDR
jgi:sarcosine oxidase